MAPSRESTSRLDFFALALASLLRESRRRQHLTQGELADRTVPAISKAAIANYELGHRSLRIDVFFTLARALGENPGAMMAEAERVTGIGLTGPATSALVDVDALRESKDPRLAPVQRWFAVRVNSARGPARHPASKDARIPAAHPPAPNTVVLGSGAINALAALMHVSPVDCREIVAAYGPGAVRSAIAS